MNNLETPGIVLQTHSVREADVIAVLLSPELGRISAIARNAKKSQKRFMGGFDVFDCGVFRLTRPKIHSQPYVIEDLSKREYWPALREDLKKFSAACFCLEVTLPFVKEEDQSAGHLFSPLYKCLKAIHVARTAEETLTLALFFNLLLLKISGFNFVEDSSRLSKGSNLSTWLEQMLAQESPIVPYDLSLLKIGFQSLVIFTQEIIGKEIRSARELI